MLRLKKEFKQAMRPKQRRTKPSQAEAAALTFAERVLGLRLLSQGEPVIASPSQALSQLLNLTERQSKDAIRKLVDAKVLKLKFRQAGPGRPALYIINAKAFEPLNNLKEARAYLALTLGKERGEKRYEAIRGFLESKDVRPTAELIISLSESFSEAYENELPPPVQPPAPPREFMVTPKPELIEALEKKRGVHKQLLDRVILKELRKGRGSVYGSLRGLADFMSRPDEDDIKPYEVKDALKVLKDTGVIELSVRQSSHGRPAVYTINNNYFNIVEVEDTPIKE